MRPLPELMPWTSWFWTSGRRRHAAHPGLRRLRRARAPARRRSARRAGAGPPAPSGVGAGHGRRVHDQCPPVAPGFDAAVRDRRRRAGRGRRPSGSPPTSSGASPPTCASASEVAVRFEQHEDVWLPLFEPTGEPDRRRPGRPSRTVPAPRAAARRRALRAPRRCSPASAGQPIGRRLMVDPLSLTIDACLAAVADAGLTARRHRRPVDLSGRRRHGHERGWRHRGRGGPAPPPDLDQRRRRHPRAGRRRHRRDAGGAERAVPPRAVLPHGLGVHLRRPCGLAGRSGGGGRASGSHAVAHARTGPCRRPTGSA